MTPPRRPAHGPARALVLGGTVAALTALSPGEPPAVETLLSPALPARVHVFEDYETVIEKRWWLRGEAAREDLAPPLSQSLPNTTACRATATKDFDDLQGDPEADWKAVIFNPVPGPPMGARTRLAFRYRLSGSPALRVQIYSLTNNYHRQLVLSGLEQNRWISATADLTAARRPDGSGGPLSADERIDDIQFYVTPEAELQIDDIVLYEAAPEGETRPFPRRILFTGWFDTGQQGAGHEWPGDFAIVPHDPPRGWKCARSVPHPDHGRPWIRVSLRGPRPLAKGVHHLRFGYLQRGSGPIEVVLRDSIGGAEWRAALAEPREGAWTEETLSFSIEAAAAFADELLFLPPAESELSVDDLLLFEPGPAPQDPS